MRNNYPAIIENTITDNIMIHSGLFSMILSTIDL
jgi:hypothetical protein